MSGIPPGLAAGSAAAKPRVKATVRLQHMKFMQKAAAKTQAAAASQKADAVVEEGEQWMAAGSSEGGAGCCVIVEDAPPPAAALGRMSFGSFNPAVEALQTAAEQARAAASQSGSNAATVSNAAVAATLGDRGNGNSSRADAARAEAAAGMSGRIPVGTSAGGANSGRSQHAGLPVDDSGMIPLLPTADAHAGQQHDGRQKQKHSGKKRGRAREGQVDIQPLRQKHKKHHARIQTRT